MINEFRGENRFLSNFYTLEDTTLHGYTSVENFFQAMKSLEKEYRLQLKKVDPKQAKKLGRRVELRDDWETIKLDVMLYALRMKFKVEPLRSKLIATGDQELLEGNYWGDTYWGICLKKNKGLNKLGKILMQVRAEYQ